MRTRLAALISFSTLVACGGQNLDISEGDESFTDTKGKAVVYGTDNRTDVYAHADATLKTRAMASTVALIAASDVDLRNPASVGFRASTLAQAEGLCSGQRFASDPTAAFCSGTLVDDDVVMTAGHCVTSAADCASTRFVFKYYRTSANGLETVTSEDVFSCAGIIARDERQTTAGASDFAFLRLNRKATPRFAPAPMRTSRNALVTGQRVAVIGSGSGIPFKIDSGGSVRDPGNGASFVATTDTFGGNSGSGVYEVDGYTVAGILVEGDTDYVGAGAGACNVVNVCRETGCGGETVVYAATALAGFCAVTTSTRLCGARAEPPVALPPAVAYSASQTASATRNTVDTVVTLRAGQTLSAGTCQVPGATGTADTFIRVMSGTTTVAQDDDACGRLSFVRFTAPKTGTYVIKGGCYGATACTGTLAYSVN